MDCKKSSPMEGCGGRPMLQSERRGLSLIILLNLEGKKRCFGVLRSFSKTYRI